MAKKQGWVENGIGYIPLTRGQIAKVNPEHVPWLTQRNWNAFWYPHTRSYIARRVEESAGKVREVKMHRFIKGVTDPSTKVDHCNHDTLDNRDSNLRVCSNQNNVRNQRKHVDNTSGYKGVSFVPRCKKKRFRAYITTNGKQHHLGYFLTAKEAHESYCEAAVRLYGEFACFGETPND